MGGGQGPQGKAQQKGRPEAKIYGAEHQQDGQGVVGGKKGVEQHYRQADSADYGFDTGQTIGSKQPPLAAQGPQSQEQNDGEDHLKDRERHTLLSP